MGDVFKEQIVKRQGNFKDTLKKVGIVIAVIVITFVSMLIPYVQEFFYIVMAAAVFGAYQLFSFINVEYEYLFTNGELDIDIIYSRSRRKRQFTGFVKDFEIMAHVENPNCTRSFDNAQETKDYSSGQVLPNTYAFLTTYKGKRLKIIIEPNEMMVNAISTVLSPRKFIK